MGDGVNRRSLEEAQAVRFWALAEQHRQLWEAANAVVQAYDREDAARADPDTDDFMDAIAASYAAMEVLRKTLAGAALATADAVPGGPSGAVSQGEEDRHPIERLNTPEIEAVLDGVEPGSQPPEPDPEDLAITYGTVHPDDPLVHGNRWRQERDELQGQVRQLQQERDEAVVYVNEYQPRALAAERDRDDVKRDYRRACIALEEAEARLASLTEALRYIAGFDVAGYEAHMRSEEVAEKALAALDAAMNQETNE